ncbi:MAG: hypothetical protein JNL10_05025 [Verrucomicrobiales bacterium]|nr:hypothetical protein [Verrucomicrobiales bacterium]
MSMPSGGGKIVESGRADAGGRWFRVLHFRDPRSPSEIRQAFERDTLVLWAVKCVGRELRMNAETQVEGVRFQLELRFLAATRLENFYSLEAVGCWDRTDRANFDHQRHRAEGWFQGWTRELREIAPPFPGEPYSEHYGERCEVALSHSGNLRKVADVQRAILEGMRRGGTFGRVHKEGGTSIFWRRGRFVRLDYGDNPGRIEFADEVSFLRMLWEFHEWKVRPSASSVALQEFDAWTVILRQMSADGGARVLFPRWSNLLGAGLLILLAGGIATWQFLTIKSAGFPLGQVARSSTHVFQVFGTVERRLPGFRRLAMKERLRIDLRAVSIADPSQQESFHLLTQPLSTEIMPMTRILGLEGDVVWVQALDLFAIDLTTGRVLRSADLAALNGGLGGFLTTARFHFDGRLVAVAPDEHQAYVFPVDSFKAIACPPPPRGTWMDEQVKSRFESSLCSGGWLSAGEWLALAPRDDPRDLPEPGKRLPRDFSPGRMDRKLSVFRGTADPSLEHATIQACRRISDAEYPSGVLLRSRPGGDLLQLRGPDSVLLLSWKQGGYQMTRLSPGGEAIWSMPTGLGQLMQVLPGTDVVVLVGVPTPTQDRSADPVLLLVEVTTGQIRGLSLWR